MPTIHAIHGFLGAGKTTLARRLEQTLPALRLNSDEWMVRPYGPDPPEEVFRPALARVQAVQRDLAERALALGLEVVLDDGYWTRTSRDALRAWAHALGAPLKLYALNLPDEEAWRRIEARNRQPGSLHVAAETYALFRQQYEPLMPDEPHEDVSPGGYPGPCPTT